MMTRIENDEEYLNTKEAMKFFEAPNQRFYKIIKPQLPVHRFDGKTTPWYKKSDMEALKAGKTVRKADISIEGMFSDWTKHLEGLGYLAATLDDTREITTLPEEAIKKFKLPADRLFFKRERMSYANGVPICVWSTYYPADLLEDVLDDLVKGESIHVIEYIKDKYGFIVKSIEERYTARITTFEEEARFRTRNEQAVLTLQRVCCTKDDKDLVLYSDMVLLGDWFDAKRRYTVDHWDN